MVGTQEAAFVAERTQQPNAPPWTVVALALALGGVLVGGTTTGGYLLTHNTLGPSPLAPPVVVAPAVIDAPIAQPPNDWRALLSASSCAAPCAGGQLCASKTVECTSGLACIPGTGAE